MRIANGHPMLQEARRLVLAGARAQYKPGQERAGRRALTRYLVAKGFSEAEAARLWAAADRLVASKRLTALPPQAMADEEEEAIPWV